MPIFMDVHIVPGVKARDVAEAHRKDLFHQNTHACKCMTYWVDEERENVFCLIEAPNKEAVIELHSEAHGLIPNKVVEVRTDVVASFLGRIYDPESAIEEEDGLKIFHDPSFRVLVFFTHEDPLVLEHKLGEGRAQQLLSFQKEIIRKKLSAFGGREAEYNRNGFIFSFSSATKAIEYALDIHENLSRAELAATEFRLAMHGGEPIERSKFLFGDAIRYAENLSFIANKGQVIVSGLVRDLVSKDHSLKEEPFCTFSATDEKLIQEMFDCLDNHWQDPDFCADDFSKALALSKSQLYRKIIALAGKAPNLLVRDYRLAKACGLLKKEGYNIAQATFDSGFTSPSYFTKCFKSKYGMLPLAYLEMNA